MKSQWFTKGDKAYNTAGPFSDFGMFRIFLRPGIVNSGFRAGLPHLHRKEAGILTLHRLLEELAS
jgi:hypothetical protein